MRGVIVVLLIASGCGDNRSAAVDAGVVVDAVTEIGDAAVVCPAASSFPALHRTMPAIPRQTSGGVATSAWTVVTITVAGDPLADRLHAFGDALVASSWLKTVGTQFQLGPATGMHLRDAPAIATPMSPRAVATYLEAYLAGRSDLPTGKVIYLLYGTAQDSFEGDFGYHTTFAHEQGHLDAAFAPIARPPFLMYPESDLDMMTWAASHEIIEAATDFDGTGYRYATPDPAWSGSIWASLQGGPVEVADVCTAGRVVEGPYYYARVFANDSAICGGDPCLPASAEHYFNVSAPLDWYAAGAGEVIEIPVIGWSTVPMENWVVYPTRLYGDPTMCGGAYCPQLTLTTPLGTGTGAPCTPLAAMNNGVAGTLRVEMPANATSGEYHVISLLSFVEGAGPNGCNAPDGEDYYHPWEVGVYVP